MDLQFWTELHSALVSLESNPKTRVLIFLSKLKRDIFTAGNDIKELYAPETTAKRYEKFWRVQTTFLTRLLVSPLVTIAGIRGAWSGGRRHVVLVLRLSRTNDAQNELVWSERGDVGDTGAEILGVAVLRGDFEQSVGGEVIVARRFGETERGVEIRVDRRGMRGRDVGEKSDGNRGEDETVTTRRVREDEN